MNVNDRKRLEQSALFSGLSGEELDSMLRYLKAQEESCGRGEVLIRCGEPVTRFVFVLSGSVKIFGTEDDGTKLIMESCGPGESFGEELCFPGTKESPVTAIAAEDCRYLRLSMENITDPSSGCFDHSAVSRVMAVMAQRSFDLSSRVLVLSQRTLRKKIHMLLVQYSKKAESRTFVLPLSREDMASFLGCDRSALSRELARMKNDGLIDYYRNSFKVVK